MADIPKHPVEVTINIGGESWEYVQHRMRDLYLEAAQRTPDNFQMFGGGAGGSYSVTTTTRDISLEEYRAELEKWFEQQTSIIAPHRRREHEREAEALSVLRITRVAFRLSA